MLTCTAFGDGVNAFVALDTCAQSHKKQGCRACTRFFVRHVGQREGHSRQACSDNRLLTTLQGELTGTRLLVIVRLTAVSKRLVVNTMP